MGIALYATPFRLPAAYLKFPMENTVTADIFCELF